MNEYIIRMELLSHSIIGKGESWGSLIDNDVVFDEVGLPYFPARRLKGLLRESSYEVVDMLRLSKIDLFDYEQVIKEAFGFSGASRGSMLVFNNLHIPDYDTALKWLQWGIPEFPSIISPNVVINHFTEMRQQTAIGNDGVGDPNSLRVSRVLKPGLIFEGSVFIKEDDPNIIKLLALSIANLRYVGTMRHRGYGEVECTLWMDEDNISEETVCRLEGRLQADVCTRL